MTVIAHLWQSTLYVAVAAIVVLMLRHAPARYRYAVWMLAAAKFLVPFAFLVAIGGALSARFAPAVWPLAAWINSSLPFLTLRSGTSELWTPSGGVNPIWWGLKLVWIAGAAVSMAWRLRQWRAAVGIVQHARRLDFGREADALARAMQKSTCARPIALRQGDSRFAPGIVGVLTPTIVWPAGLSERLTDDELEAVLAHEIAHVERHDNLMAWLQIAAETLFWFYPLTWWLGTRIVNERERACDEEVVHMGTDTRTYAAGILKVCNFCLCPPAAFVAGVSSSNLAQRIARIVTGAPRTTRATAARLTGLCFGLAMTVPPLTLGALGLASSGPQQDVYSMKQPGVTAPRLVKETKPGYTAEALHARIEGIVKLEAVVRADGKVGNVKITQSLDKEFGLDDRAIATIKKWEFEPGRKGGKAVPVRVEIEISFTLK
jgi:TonB family protein